MLEVRRRRAGTLQQGLETRGHLQLRANPTAARMGTELDQRVRQPATAVPVVALAGASRQGLQRGAQSRAAFTVERAPQRIEAVLAQLHLEVPRLDSRYLTGDERGRCGHVPRMGAEVSEAPDAQIPRLREQLGLVDAPTRTCLFDRRGRARDQSQMSEPDVTRLNRINAERHAGRLVADGHPIGRGPTAHAAVVPDPVNR